MADGRETDVLTLRFLGEVEVLRGSTPIVLPSSRKARALLAYLSVTGRPHRRDRLCDLLWEDTDDPRGALRWSLTKLRGVVNDDTTRIVADREVVRFEANEAAIDVLALRNAKRDPTSCPVSELERLAMLVRGPFLEGLELTDLRDFHAWCVAEREEARRLHVRILKALIEQLADRVEEALPHARTLASVDGSNEASHATLVGLLGAAGRRDEAEQHYEAATARLHERGITQAGTLLSAWQRARKPTGRPAAGAPQPTLPRRKDLDRHETRYVKCDGVHIAYQVVGHGPPLLFIPGWVSHIEHAWEEPTYARFLHGLASFSTLILMDRRGTGLSDPVAELPTLERRMEDVHAVLDAAALERAAVFAVSESGPMSLLFAATYPKRTTSLALYGTFAKLGHGKGGSRRPDTIDRDSIRSGYGRWGEAGFPPETIEAFLDMIESTWGAGEMSKLWAPSIAEDEDAVVRWGRFERLAVSPGAARRLFAMAFGVDVSHVLPSISVSTLCMGRADDDLTPFFLQRYIADRIPGARLVELDGADHFPWVGDSTAILAELERHVTGALAEPRVEPERVLATVLFTDIVGSTAQLARMGDRKWGDLLRRHHAAVRSQLERYRGREVDTTGDGMLATFDGPARGIQCGRAIVDAVGDLGLEVRVGLHTGECELVDGKIAGIAVHIGARCASQAAPGEVLVSRTVKDLVAGSGIEFESRGEQELKGVPGRWELLRVSAV